MDKFLLRIASKWHPRYNGIIFRNGFKCGTDGHFMVIIKADYPQEYEGKILTHKGKLLDGAVNFMNGIPQMKYAVEIDFNFKDFSRIYKQYTEEKRNTPKDLRPLFYAVQIGENRFKIEQLKLFVTAARKVGATKFYINRENKPLVATNGENYSVLMPLMPFIDEAKMKIYQMCY
jgi:hypothetical protein